MEFEEECTEIALIMFFVWLSVLLFFVLPFIFIFVSYI